MTSEATLKQRPTNSHSHCTNTATTSALQPQQPNNNNDHSHRNSVMMVKLTPQAFRILGLLSVLCILLSVIGAPSIEDNMHDGLVLKSNERLSRSSGNSAMSKQMMMPESAPMMADSLEMDMAVGAEESVSFHGVPKAYNQHMEQALQELDSKTYVTERMLIKSGNIVAEVSNLSQSVEKVTNILQEYKEGFIEHQSQESNTRYHPYGTAQQQQAIRMTARVPSEHFETIIDTIQQAVGTQNVLEVHTNARDVTDQYVDAATRADVLQASRQALQTLLDKAHNVREVMEVQRELNRIVEQYESQKKRAESLKAQSVRDLGVIRVHGLSSIPVAVAFEHRQSSMCSLLFIHILLTFYACHSPSAPSLWSFANALTQR